MDLRSYLFEAMFDRPGELVVRAGQVMARANGGLRQEEREHLKKYKFQLVELWMRLGAGVGQEVPDGTCGSCRHFDRYECTHVGGIPWQRFRMETASCENYERNQNADHHG